MIFLDSEITNCVRSLHNGLGRWPVLLSVVLSVGSRIEGARQSTPLTKRDQMFTFRGQAIDALGYILIL